MNRVKSFAVAGLLVVAIAAIEKWLKEKARREAEVEEAGRAAYEAYLVKPCNDPDCGCSHE